MDTHRSHAQGHARPRGSSFPHAAAAAAFWALEAPAKCVLPFFRQLEVGLRDRRPQDDPRPVVAARFDDGADRLWMLDVAVVSGNQPWVEGNKVMLL